MSEPAETSSPYCLAVSYQQERRARQAYDQAQVLLFEQECELSAFCFYVGPTWYVAIVGEQPDSGLDQRLRMLLAHGTLTQLPEDVLSALLKRRARATQIGPWVEAHYDQGADEP